MDSKRFDFVVKLRSGRQGKVNLIRDSRTPKAKRRGVALHIYYDILKQPLPGGYVLRQKHRDKGHTSTTYASVHEGQDVVVPLCTVRWVDDGAAVTIKEIIGDSGMSDECLAKLVAQTTQ